MRLNKKQQPGILVLTRKRGEAVVLHYPKPDGTTGRVLVVLENIKGSHTAKLAFEAGADVKILREELEYSETSKPLAVG